MKTNIVIIFLLSILLFSCQNSNKENKNSTKPCARLGQYGNKPILKKPYIYKTITLAAGNFRCLRTGSEGDISIYERHH
jgi:hypothetical protein